MTIPSLHFATPLIPALILGASSLTLSAAPTHIVDESPVEISRIDKDTLLIDFGKAAYGNVRLMPSAIQEGAITVHYGEDLQGGRINRKPPGTVRYNKATVALSGTEAIIADPPADARNTELISGERVHPPAILTPAEWGVVLPFRWVEIEGWDGDLKPTEIVRQTAYASTWDDDAASFESSDETLNRIWELCKYSIKATTFAGIYVDGDRERIPYEADAYLNQLSHYYTDHDKEMARDTIDHLLLNGTWPTEWAPHMVFMVYADYMHTGDKGWMAGRISTLKDRMLMDRRGEDNLISSDALAIKKLDIVDWPQKERDKFVFTPRNNVVNAFHIQVLKLMIIMSRDLGLTADVKQFEEQLAASEKAFQETFFNEEKGLYVDGIGTDHTSSHANFFPLAFGITPQELREKKVDWLVQRGMAMSVYAAQYFMEALFENGADTEALALITADGDRSWKHMVNSGTTISWEAWDQKYKPNQDWNHAWGAAPANLFPRYLLGAQPLTPGWDIARISPKIGDLESAQGKIPTRLGPILIQWSQQDTFKMSLELPDEMTAQVDLPKIENSTQVLLNGKPITATERDGRWVLEDALSGKAELEVK